MKKLGRESPYFIDKVGEEFTNKAGHRYRIIECFRYNNCTIQFEDGFTIYNADYRTIKNGNMRNPNDRTICAIGYLGIGIYKSGSVAYKIWKGVIQRCYSEKNLNKCPSYMNVTVCPEWHNFQNFAQWHEENYKLHMKGWHLDKDIICKNCKIYSPETCIFVPHVINNLFIRQDDKSTLRGTGKNGSGFLSHLSVKNKYTYLGTFRTEIEAFQAYKVARELYIKEIANEWKDRLDEKAYQALYNYAIDITD